MKIWFYPDTNIFRRLIDRKNIEGIHLLRSNPNAFKLTPTTIMELVEDLVTCQSQNFLQRREALELAKKAGGRRVLPASGEFLARHVFGSAFANPHLSPSKVKQWLDAAVRYSSQQSLGTAVEMRNYQCRLDAGYIAKVNQQVRSLTSRWQATTKIRS